MDKSNGKSWIPKIDEEMRVRIAGILAKITQVIVVLFLGAAIGLVSAITLGLLWKAAVWVWQWNI